MPRITRSQRINVAEDSTALASLVPSLDVAPSELQILADLPQGSNTMPAVEEDNFNIDASLKSLKAAYRTAIGGGRKNKKGRNKKKDKEEAQFPDEGPAGDNAQGKATEVDTSDEQKDGVQPAGLVSNRESQIAEEIVTSPTDPDTDNERNINMNENESPASHITQQQNAQEDQATLADVIGEEWSDSLQNYILSLSAVDEHSIPLTSTKEQHSMTEDDGTPELMKYLVQDGTLKTRPRSPIKTLDEVERECGPQDISYTAATEADDSFIETIICRSPAKPVSRIEDSVEALDQLEDAFDALDQAVSAEQFASPQKIRQRASKQELGKSDTTIKEMAGGARATSRAASRADSNTRGPKPLKSGYASVRIKSVTPRAPALKRSTSLVFRQPPSVVHDGKASPQPVKRAAPKKLVSLLPPKELVKSSKPPTQPTKYELPGEIFVRKLKEQREARLAHEPSDEALQPSRVVSATRVKSTKPLTKPAFELPSEALSKKKKEAQEARLNALEVEDRKRREFKAKPIRTSTAPVPRETILSRARQSKVGTVSPHGGNNAVANSSAPRAPGIGATAQRRPSTKFSGPSMSGMATQRTISSHEQSLQRHRAKEIYNRDLRATEDIEREKREREAAAKRSREEAAERGRQASREWAEKQRLKKMAEGDKGMSAGYGPGGQMGLRG